MNPLPNRLVSGFLILLLAAFPGCKREPVRITELKWGNPTKEWVARNKVDSVFLISRNRILNLGLSDTVGLITYDAAGNVLYESHSQIFGNITYYRYDSNNLLSMERHVTDYADEAGLRYKFYPDSMVVDQISYDYGSPDSVRQIIRHRFNRKGRLISSESLFGRSKTNYHYDAGERLISVISRSSLRSDSSNLQYFYTANLPDSMVLTDYRGNKPSVTRTYFDSRGLVTRTVMWDTIVTHYSYPQRKR